MLPVTSVFHYFIISINFKTKQIIINYILAYLGKFLFLLFIYYLRNRIFRAEFESGTRTPRTYTAAYNPHSNAFVRLPVYRKQSPSVAMTTTTQVAV